MTDSARLTTIAAVGDTLWSHWRSMGVPAACKPAERLIDPEALIVYTALFTDAFGDDRLRDGAISWCIDHHSLVASARIKKLHARASVGNPDAFLALAHQVGAHVKRLPWPAADSAPSWTPSTRVRLPQLDHDVFLLRLRCRALFGANARGEAIAYLACTGDWATLAAIEHHTCFSRTQIDEAATGLVQAGAMQRGSVSNSTRYSLSSQLRMQLSTPIVEHRIGNREFDVISSPAAPTWIDWSLRFELLWHLIDAAAALDDGDLIGATAALRAHAEEFREAHMTAPTALRGQHSTSEHAETLQRFIQDAIVNVGGRGLFP